MDKLAAMQVFVKVVETGALSAAGRALGLAPPSISRRISELEDFLGVRLLQRTTRSLSLTEAGEAYYERSRQIVQAVEEANLSVTEIRADPSGTLRITVSASVARLHIAPAIAAFQMRYPKVRAVVQVSDRLVDMIEDGLDVAIRIGRLEDSSLIARKLGAAKRLVCASPAYLDRASKPRNPTDLKNHACLSYRTHAGSSLWRFRKGKNDYNVHVSGPYYADDGETLVAGACAGLGVVLTPEWLVGEAIADGRLVEVLKGFTPKPEDTPLYAMYAPGPYTSPKIRAFVDFLAARFSKGYNWRA